MISGPRHLFGSLLAAGLVAGLLGSTPPASAQLSLPTFTNNSNPNETVAGTATTPSRERQSATSLASSSPGSAFVTRYTSLVTTDSDGASASAGIESMSSDYTIDFTVTAPGAYLVTVDTHLSGDFNLVNDGASGATADISGVSGSFTGGTLTSGSLDLDDPGAASGNSGGSIGIDQSGTATIFGVSDGSTMPHSLRFVFIQSATSTANGDEAAIRLGDTSHVATETAGDYPGNPSRTQTADGHFVTVSVMSLCGNGMVDPPLASYSEDCDEGPNNGAPDSCCASNCKFKPNGSSCDDGDACTVGDACTNGACQATSTQICGLCERCSSLGGCEIGPRLSSCKQPTVMRKASLQVKDLSTDASDQLVYKWTKGIETQTTEFGDPVNTDDYALCVFDGAGGLLFKSDAPHGDACNATACWKTLGIKGFSYRDPERTPNGADRVQLKAGLSGKAKVQYKGKGPNLPFEGSATPPQFPPLTLPLTLPVTVQLQSTHTDLDNPHGTCFEATFSDAGASKNDGTLFKGKSD